MYNHERTTENILSLEGQVIASKRFEGTFDGNYYFYYYDIRQSVSGIFGPANEVIKDYQYTLYGEITEGGNPDFKNEIGYTGSITDETGLNYMHARFYSSNTGRFISEDSFGGYMAQPWTQNLYSYCGNNPVNMIDPTGYFPTLSSALGTVNCGGLPKSGCSCFRCTSYWKDRVDVSKEISEMPELAKPPIIIQEPSRTSKSAIVPKQTNSSMKSNETTSKNDGVINTLKNGTKIYSKLVLERNVRDVEMLWKFTFAKNETGTKTAGVTLGGGMGLGGSLTGGLAADKNGNVGLILGVQGGGMTPNRGVSVFAQETNAPNINDLKKVGLQLGSSVSVYGPIGVGYDYSLFNSGGATYDGHSLSLGVSTSSFELHGGVGYSWIPVQINIFDIAYDILDQIYNW